MYPAFFSALSCPHQQKAYSHQIFHFCRDLHCSCHTTVALNIDVATSTMLDVNLIVRKKGVLIGHNRQVARVEGASALRPSSC